MQNHLLHYVQKLSRSETVPDFAAVTCRYGKFTMYCLIGPEENIVQVTFASEKHERLQKQLKVLNSNVHIKKLLQQHFPLNDMFADYFCGRLSRFPVSLNSPLIAAGTDFQKKVWRHIAAIPYGSYVTYQRLAQLAGSPGGARAVGLACGANPVAVIIPCHRVVAVGGPGGFAGGVAIKEALLALEQTGRNAPR